MSLAILEALHVFTSHFHASLVMESYLINAIHWISSPAASPGNFLFFFIKEIKFMHSQVNVFFKHVGPLADVFADSLAK